MSGKTKMIVIWILCILLGLAFLMAGGTKLMGDQMHVDNFTRWGYPSWSLMGVGIIELIMGMGIIIPSQRKWALPLVYIWALGAIGTHIMNGEYKAIVVNFFFVLIAWLIGWLGKFK